MVDDTNIHIRLKARITKYIYYMSYDNPNKSKLALLDE